MSIAPAAASSLFVLLFVLLSFTTSLLLFPFPFVSSGSSLLVEQAATSNNMTNMTTAKYVRFFKIYPPFFKINYIFRMNDFFRGVTKKKEHSSEKLFCKYL